MSRISSRRCLKYSDCSSANSEMKKAEIEKQNLSCAFGAMTISIAQDKACSPRMMSVSIA